jgi:hypothetical protein
VSIVARARAFMISIEEIDKLHELLVKFGTQFGVLGG